MFVFMCFVLCTGMFIFLNVPHIIAHLSEQVASPLFHCLYCPSSALSFSIQKIALRCSQRFATYYIIYGSLSGEICTKSTINMATRPPSRSIWMPMTPGFEKQAALSKCTSERLALRAHFHPSFTIRIYIGCIFLYKCYD